MKTDPHSKEEQINATTEEMNAFSTALASVADNSDVQSGEQMNEGQAIGQMLAKQAKKKLLQKNRFLAQTGSVQEENFLQLSSKNFELSSLLDDGLASVEIDAGEAEVADNTNAEISEQVAQTEETPEDAATVEVGASAGAEAAVETQ
jgi:hypothetical protein